jgi:hypothetical protein
MRTITMINVLLLTVHLPGSANPVLGGFVITEEGSRAWTIDFHSDWLCLCADEAEVLETMELTLQTLVEECEGTGRDFVRLLESQFSNTIRCGERLTLPRVRPIPEQRQLLRAAFGFNERPVAI